MNPRTLLISIAALLALASGSATSMDEPDPSDALAAKNPDFAQGRRAVEARDWKTAIQRLNAADKRTANNAEIYNLLGFAYRNDGQVDVAIKHYQRALQIESRHLGAHEYIGEAYLMLNDPAKAEEHLAALKRLCPSVCPERDELANKVAQYRTRK